MLQPGPAATIACRAGAGGAKLAKFTERIVIRVIICI